MDFLELVKKARSCRRFMEDQPLEQKDLHWLLECARFTPCARNAQNLRYITVSQGEVCQKLFHLTRWAGALKDWNGPENGERPTAFIVILMPENGDNLLYMDAGIVSQTIQLAATSRGWGACMIYSFDRQQAVSLLNIPGNFKPVLVIGLGKEKEKRVLEAMPANGSFAYWRDAEGVHHVPKRSLDELIVTQFEK